MNAPYDVIWQDPEEEDVAGDGTWFFAECYRSDCRWQGGQHEDVRDAQQEADDHEVGEHGGVPGVWHDRG